ncbi:hypothetical protein I3760_13G119200 [Carya illinoinensis]|nr:hypothetical protein I3760_13G119200 [Carya illinoinensis]
MKKVKMIEVNSPIEQPIQDSVGSSLKEYMTSKKNEEQQIYGEEIHELVSMVLRITKYELCNVVPRQMHGGTEELKCLKWLSDNEKKKNWIRFSLANPCSLSLYYCVS